MREIKFRGYYNGDSPLWGKEPGWCYGDLWHDIDGNPIIYETVGMHSPCVLPDTVGQYTGLKDRDGNEIYEGDILANTRRDDIVRVVWSDNNCGWYFSDIGNTAFPERSLTFYAIQIRKLRVIGNAHDNPELLKPKKKQ